MDLTRPYSRGDTAGALNSVLEGAPYGQNVDEAKVNHGLFIANSEAASFILLVGLGLVLFDS